MKNILFVLILIVGLGCAKKEDTVPQTSKIEVLKTSVEDNGLASDADIVVKSSIKNLTGDNLVIKWKRILKNVPTGWEMAVCDVNVCYFHQIDSATFDLAPNESAKLWAYFYPGDSVGQGRAKIQVYEVSQPEKSFVIDYKATATK